MAIAFHPSKLVSMGKFENIALPYRISHHSCIIFLKIWAMVSNFKFIPYFIILQNFVENERKKWPYILSCFYMKLTSTHLFMFLHSFNVQFITEPPSDHKPSISVSFSHRSLSVQWIQPIMKLFADNLLQFISISILKTWPSSTFNWAKY